MTDNSQYQPGVCNIGPYEINKRRNFGIAASIATLLLYIVLVILHANQVVRFFLFIPAAGAALGFLQARYHFCANFGLRHLFNLSAGAHTETVLEKEARIQDRDRAVELIVYACLIGMTVAALLAILPF